MQVGRQVGRWVGSHICRYVYVKAWLNSPVGLPPATWQTSIAEALLRGGSACDDCADLGSCSMARRLGNR